VSARTLLTVAAFSFAMACSAQSAGAARATGLHGRVVIEPGMPVCRVGDPCTRPAKDLELAFLRKGRVVGTTTTDEQGRYRIALPAGRYAVRPRVQHGLRKALEPGGATVPRGRYARRDFTLDIGIR
jgi:hypothetical protein